MTTHLVRRGAVRLAVLALCLLPACQQKMARQPHYRPDESTKFFPDGRVNRPQVAGTVARGHLRIDTVVYTGNRPALEIDMIKAATLVGAPALDVRALSGAAAIGLAGDSQVVDTFPFPITQDVLKRGQERFMIYCVVCHDPLGTGHGMIVQRGYTAPPSYHIERLRQAPVGHFFEVMTKGYGSMPAYGKQVPPRDRWAIAAYVRAIQLSQRFPENQITDELRRAWAKSGAPGVPAAPGGRQ